MFMFNDPPRERDLPLRILVVDDEKDILRIIKRDLESNDANFKVDAFYDGESALNAFNSHPTDYYDLVLTDIRMPKMNGFELYRHIKQRNPAMKIAFITAFEITKEEFGKVLPSIDVKHFIKKPVTMSNLIPKLRSIVDN